MANYRMQKINAEILKIVSEIINKNLSEKLFFPVIDEVITKKDLSEAKIFVYFSTEDPQKQFEKLIRHSSLIQKDFGEYIKLRKTPHLKFILDTKKTQIEKVEQILEKLSKKNEN